MYAGGGVLLLMITQGLNTQNNNKWFVCNQQMNNNLVDPAMVSWIGTIVQSCCCCVLLMDQPTNKNQQCGTFLKNNLG